jgi:eukaryotic-like serine/threonine-protein kinase
MSETFPIGLESRYRIVEKLGAGGYGEIFRAFWLQTGTEVALKVLKSVVDTDVDRQRFRREAEVAKRLTDAHSVRVLDFGQDPAAPAFISFELLQGRTLNHVIAEGALTEARAIGLGVQIASSLAEAHLLGIVHRDIKPANIMLLEGFPGDFVKVMDFGIAKVISNEGGTALTADGEMLGTPSYMAPEQIRGDHVGPHTDVYSLALLLVECLTGTRLVGRAGPVDACIVHLSDEPHVLPPAVRQSCVGSVLAHALQKKPAQRLVSMAMFHAQLKERLPNCADSVLVAAPEGAPAPDVNTLRLPGAPPKPAPPPPQLVTAPMPAKPSIAAPSVSPSKVLAAPGMLPMAAVSVRQPLAATVPSPGQPPAMAASPVAAVVPAGKKGPPIVLVAIALLLVTAAGAAAGWFAIAR